MPAVRQKLHLSLCSDFRDQLFSPASARTDGYVRQGQKTLEATAEFKLGREAQSKLEADGKLTSDEFKHIMKQAIESQAHESVVVREDRLFAGSALKVAPTGRSACARL